MPSPTYAQIASSYALWQEHIDPNATTSRADFDAMNHADRVAQIIETFGPEPEPVPIVDEILAQASIGCGLHRWAVEGGSLRLTTDQLRPFLEKAYDAADPDWMVWVDVEEVE